MTSLFVFFAEYEFVPEEDGIRFHLSSSDEAEGMKFCKDFVHFFVYGGVDFILIEEKEGFF